MQRAARSLAGLFGAALLTIAGATSAAAEMSWNTFEAEDFDGTPLAGLYYGVPETDDTLLYAGCLGTTPAAIELTLYIDSGSSQIGDRPTISFVPNTGTTQQRQGVIVEHGEFGYVPILQTTRGDGIWNTLRRASSVGISAGGGVANVSLRGSSAAIDTFLAACDRVWAASAPTLAALPGPLYVVAPGADINGYADANGSSVVTQFPPGVELMATNATQTVNGVLRREVVADRGAGIYAWVDAGGLVPTSGGAGEYQNLNTAANLVLRNGPSPTAASVTTVPPGARGIFETGGRNGDYVFVRVGEVFGWAAHEYLRPYLDAPDPIVATGPVDAPAAAPSKTPKGPSPAPDAFDPNTIWLGEWYDFADGRESGAGLFFCVECTLDVADAGGSLSLTSSYGWVANIIWGADDDVGYGTGNGFWSYGELAGQGFSIDITIAEGTAEMAINMVMASGEIRTYRYVRGGLG